MTVKQTWSRFNDWVTDPDHNRVLALIIAWTTICAGLTAFFAQIHMPITAAMWAVLTVVNLLTLIRAIFE